MEVQNFLEEKFPHLIDRISGDLYPAPPMNQLIASMLGYCQLLGFVLVIFGEPIFQGLDISMPDAIKQLQENKFTSFIGFMMLGSVSQSLLATSAFEIYYNDQLIFSKIAAGRWPSLPEIVKLLREHGLEGYGL